MNTTGLDREMHYDKASRLYGLSGTCGDCKATHEPLSVCACGRAVCSDCISDCAKCHKAVCKECFYLCPYSPEASTSCLKCSEDVAQCGTCNATVCRCTECTDECVVCGDLLCGESDDGKDSECSVACDQCGVLTCNKPACVQTHANKCALSYQHM